MPIREILALSVAVMGGIFIAHPLSFKSALRQVEFSILREVTRTDNWGDPSLYRTNRYMRPPRKIYSGTHLHHTRTQSVVDPSEGR
jgi:hypothetical protein